MQYVSLEAAQVKAVVADLWAKQVKLYVLLYGRLSHGTLAAYSTLLVCAFISELILNPWAIIMLASGYIAGGTLCCVRCCLLALLSSTDSYRGVLGTLFFDSWISAIAVSVLVWLISLCLLRFLCCFVLIFRLLSGCCTALFFVMSLGGYWTRSPAKFFFLVSNIFDNCSAGLNEWA